MKKTLLMSVVLIAISTLAQAQLPYLKLLDLPKEKLIENKFKYNSNKNQYVLTKTNGLNATSNIFNALNGTTADIRPHVDDYVIVRQEGEDKVSYLSATFYKDDTYHGIETWLAENNIDVIETNSGSMVIQKFKFDNLDVEFRVERVGINATTGRTNALVKTIDESYNVYTYTIYTGVEPFSKWHEKQAKKKQKRQDKGKKSDIDDLMY